MIVKRTFDDGYDDPYKQENTCVKCFTWTKGNINGICLSGVLFAFVGIAVLVSLAAWSYISTLSSLDHVKTDQPKLFASKNDIRTYKKQSEFNDYISDLKGDSSDGISEANALTPVLPDIPEIPLMGSSAAVPDTPFPLTGSDAAPDKPYIIPAQPNDLNLDLIDDSPRGPGTNDMLSVVKSLDDDHLIQDRLAHKIERINSPKLAKFTDDLPSSANRHNHRVLHLISEGKAKPHASEIMLSTDANSDLPAIASKLPPFPSLVDPDPPPNTNKVPDVNLLTPALEGNANKAHEIKKIDHLELEPPELVPMTLYRIHSAKKSGAVCLDGSVPAYYHRPGVGPSERLWIIHFNGGAWCFDAKACFERSHSSLGSTNKLPAAPPIIQGINSPDPSINPDFHDWNLVWVVYCDGASFTGDQDRPLISESGDTIYMRGKRVLNAIISDVLKNRNLKDAEALILTGSSAGSMTAIFQADYIASKLPKTIPVRVFSDAGFFIDTSSIGGKNLNEVFKNIYDMQNSSAGLHQDCIKDVGMKKGWQCFYPSKAVNYVKTPIFVLNSLYDIWALMYFIGINCKFPVVRQPERKKRSLFRNYVFPKDSELEKPYISEGSDSADDSLSYNRRQRRDISGFEIFPFFRTPVYLDPGTAFKSPETSETSESESGQKKSTIVKAKPKVRNKPKMSNVNVKKKRLPVRPTPSSLPNPSVTNNYELSDVLSHLTHMSHETTKMYGNTTSVSPQQVHELEAMLNQLKGQTSDEAFNYLSHNIAASFQRSLLKAEVTRKSIITKPNNDTSSKKTAAPTPAVKAPLKGGREGNTSKPTPQISENNRRIIQSIRLKLLDFITHHHVHNHTTATVHPATSGSTRDEIKHPLRKNKTRRSTSIAKEYINILRSDPPECTEKELLTAMLYRNLIIRATNNLIHNPKSSRFLISCINHSSSLFDDTWTTLKVGGKTIQQAFGDWFFERDDKGNYDLVDCPYPCNPTCP